MSNTEVLQEVLYRYFSIGRPDAARTVYETAKALCDTVFDIEVGQTDRALELLLESPDLSPRDAIHVATMEAHDVRRILSTDRDFDRIAFVARVDRVAFTSNAG